MKKLYTVEELHNFRNRILDEKDVQYDKPTLVICGGTGGLASGANDVIRVMKRYILERGITGKSGYPNHWMSRILRNGSLHSCTTGDVIFIQN